MKFLLLFLQGLLLGAVASAQTNPPQPLAFRIGSVRFDRPEGWSYSRPADGVLAAQLEKKSGNNPLRITFTRLPPGSAGTVQANVDRWRAQFLSHDATPEIQALSGTGLPLTLVKLTGTWRGGVPGGPPTDSPETLMLGAMMESPEGMVVVKLAGPKKTVGREEPLFLNLVKTAAGRSP